MKKQLLITFLFVIIGAILLVWLVRENQEPSSDGPYVVTSFYPIYEFTSRIAGEDMTVINIAGNSVSPHDFEPSAQDLARIEAADALIFNGAGLDAWAERLTDDVAKKGVEILELASVIDLRDATGDHENEHEEEADDHAHGDNDPHFWVDPVNAQKEVVAIRDVLIKIDSDNKAAYTERADAYIKELAQLDQDIREGLAMCDKHTIVVSHDAFGYFADRYEIDTLTIAGLSPTNEPSAQRIAEIADLVRSEGIGYIFFETLVSPRLSETIADETDAQTLVLDPVAGISEEQQERGESYISLMYQNLENLQTALQCQKQDTTASK